MQDIPSSEHAQTKHHETPTKIRDYRDLLVWQKSIDLVKMIYAATRSFPTHERFALTDQIRRAAVSIPSNIAEGSSRLGKAEFRRFLSIARGSTAEVDTQIVIACDLGYITPADGDDLRRRVVEIRRMLRGLHDAITGG